MAREIETISQALEEIYEARLALSVLGNLVDRYETGDIPFELTGTGALICNQADRIYTALDVLEEQYKLQEFEEQIKKLNAERMRYIHESVQLSNERQDIFRKHMNRAEQEVEEQKKMPQTEDRAGQA